MSNWIPLTERKPNESDANKSGMIVWQTCTGAHAIGRYHDCKTEFIAFMPLNEPYVKTKPVRRNGWVSLAGNTGYFQNMTGPGGFFREVLPQDADPDNVIEARNLIKQYVDKEGTEFLNLANILRLLQAGLHDA